MGKTTDWKRSYKADYRKKFNINDCKSLNLLKLELSSFMLGVPDLGYYKNNARKLALEELIREYELEHRLNECHIKEQQAKDDILQSVILKETDVYEQEVAEQTQASSKTILIIGASILLVGGLLIYKTRKF